MTTTGTRLAPAPHVHIPLAPGERWWGGAVADGQVMPFGGAPHRRDLAVSAGFLPTDDGPDADTDGCNQSAPLLVSNRGRYVWSDHPFTFTVADGAIRIDGTGVEVGVGGTTLREAFLAVSSRFFPAAGRTPAREMFTGPQYNSWIEMPHFPTQQAVLAYVRGLLDAGFPPGVVMIDDRWATAYGTWRFDSERFPDPRAMVDQLHSWGCPVMLWVVPFVSPDSDTFREVQSQGLLLRSADGAPALRKWWNGWSAVLDTTNPDAVSWLREQLDDLVDRYGMDGFKFDAGDLYDYRPGDLSWSGTDPAGQCEAWAAVGLSYPFNEFRACWKQGGQPLAQRLHDKPSTWGRGGLTSLIPESIAQGLIGHPFICPDMVGGGDLAVVQDQSDALDQQLFVRYAQVAALFPMMQFSQSPYRVLDDEHLSAVLGAVRLRQQLVPEILDLADHAARTGEPILRALEYHHPGYEDVRDQFLLGENVLVAPVLTLGASTRSVVLPPGAWSDPDGTLWTGPAVVDVPVTLHAIPRFRRVQG